MRSSAASCWNSTTTPPRTSGTAEDPAAAIQAKFELTDGENSVQQILVKGEYLEVEVTQARFEELSQHLMFQTLELVQNVLEESEANGITVQGIVLSGGASKMPMVKKALEEALPQFKDRIIYFRPSRAIAYGAARFGTAEVNQDPAGDTTMVQQRTVFDLGVRFYNGTDDKVGHIAIYIPAGTPIPYAGEYHGSRTLHENQRYSGFEVYEAVVSNPDRNNVFEDYVQIMEVTVDHGEGGVPVGTENESRLQVDKLGVLTIQARMKTDDGMKPVESTVQLTNLSSSV